MAKILVIEDNDDLREDILETLELIGYEVLGAENGRVGIELVLAEMPDLIVCDIMMPVMNGFEVLESLRNNSKIAMIPFIFLTAKGDTTADIGLVPDAYLVKPFEVDDLLNTIAIHLQK